MRRTIMMKLCHGLTVVTKTSLNYRKSFSTQNFLQASSFIHDSGTLHGSIECANSLSLVYTPKRMPFRYNAYKARKQLTAIDWNYHVNLPQATTKSGEERITRKYNPRTRQWDVKIVKVEKGYEYVPVLISRMLNRRICDADGVTRHISLNDSNPVLISPTIAHIPPPATKEIVQRKSRFASDDKSSK